MFLCVSLNPAIDKRLHLEGLQRGSVNRAREAVAAPGGKAAHVAMVLRALGAAPVWLGFAGGATGKELTQGLAELSIQVELVPISGSIRVNLEIIEDDGTVTEILEPGPGVTKAELRQLHEQLITVLDALAPKAATVIFSGSLPKGAPCDCYAALTKAVHQRGGRVFLDTSGEALRNAVDARPDFVKPNQSEAESLSGSSIREPESAASVLQNLMRAGVAGGAISLGADGLVSAWKGSSEVLWARAPRQESRFSVGSGDASLAGFAFAAERGFGPVESVRLAAACGAANCLAERPGLARACDIERLRGHVEVDVVASRESRS